MIDEKYIGLIQADVDGELPDGSRAELAAYLLANPQARALRDELRSVNDALLSVTQVEPPPGLAGAIVASIPASPGSARRQPRWWLQSGLLRYAAVFAGGLLAGAVVFEAGVGRHDGVDATTVAGTMIDGSAPATPVASARLALPQLNGTVSLYAASTQRILQFDLAVQEPVEIVVLHDGERATFSHDGSPGREGSLRYALVLDGPGQPGEAVQVEVVASGRILDRKDLRLPAAGS